MVDFETLCGTKLCCISLLIKLGKKAEAMLSGQAVGQFSVVSAHGKIINYNEWSVLRCTVLFSSFLNLTKYQLTCVLKYFGISFNFRMSVNFSINCLNGWRMLSKQWIQAVNHHCLHQGNLRMLQCATVTMY